MTVTKTQTQQERDAVIEAWDKNKGLLAETGKNLAIIQQSLIGYSKANGNFLSIEILNAIVKANAHQLDWLAQPEAPKPTPAKPTGNRLWNVLVNAGVEPTRHSSFAEKQAGSQRIEDAEKAILTRARLLNEQAQLLEEKSQAEYGFIVMHRLGINHARTADARKIAKAKLLPKIEDFNRRAVATGNENLVISS